MAVAHLAQPPSLAGAYMHHSQKPRQHDSDPEIQICWFAAVDWQPQQTGAACPSSLLRCQNCHTALLQVKILSAQPRYQQPLSR